MHVIGTAGHVDHGKSTLVEALTGIHPDRLKEEREREMTIDLGFAWMTLPNGEDVGIVDVPGHRDFIENMLAGLGGIDAVLFVVAADEGVMPQSREHLAILDLLNVQHGVVALTKIDLIGEDQSKRSEWLSMVEEDVRVILSGTALANAPIVPVSARSHEGLPTLVAALQRCLAEQPARANLRRPRLPVDRVFSMSGFGTVVTGTLTDGCFQVGDEICVQPHDLKGRIRGLQTHKKKVETALPGGRTAVNISGIDLVQVKRGDVITKPGDYSSTRRLDVRVRIVKDASQPVRHNTLMKLFVGTTEVVARLRVLGVDELRPGEEGWLQLELHEPILVMRGDRFILRRPSPSETIGGGFILNAQPAGRHKRFDKQVLTQLEVLRSGSPTEIILQTINDLSASSLSEIITHSNLDPSSAIDTLDQLYRSGSIIDLEGNLVDLFSQAENKSVSTRESFITSNRVWEFLSDTVIVELKQYHNQFPLRKGIPKEELKSRLKVADRKRVVPRLINILLEKMLASEKIREAKSLIWLPSHVIIIKQQEQKLVDDLMKRFASTPYAPPTIKECQAAVGEELFNALVELELLVYISTEVVFRKSDYQLMLKDVVSLIRNQGPITAAQVRDHFNTSRRYVLAFLEYLDAQGITVREGDVRRLL